MPFPFPTSTFGANFGQNFGPFFGGNSETSFQISRLFLETSFSRITMLKLRVIKYRYFARYLACLHRQARNKHKANTRTRTTTCNWQGQTYMTIHRKGFLEGSFLAVSQQPLTLTLMEKYRDTNGSHIVIQIGGVYTTSAKKRAYFCRSIAIQMGGVSRYFSKVSGSGVDLTLLSFCGNVRLCWLWRSECQMYCRAQCL